MDDAASNTSEFTTDQAEPCTCDCLHCASREAEFAKLRVNHFRLVDAGRNGHFSATESRIIVMILRVYKAELDGRLWGSQVRMSPAVIAERLGVNRKSVTRTMDLLEFNEVITRSYPKHSVADERAASGKRINRECLIEIFHAESEVWDWTCFGTPRRLPTLRSPVG